MAFDTLVRSGVALANSLTGSLQATVLHQVGTVDGRGQVHVNPVPVPRQALVERSMRTIVAFDGTEKVSDTKVTLLAPVEVGQYDRITLPDGSYGPILNVQGLLDPAGAPYLTQVWMGRGNA